MFDSTTGDAQLRQANTRGYQHTPYADSSWVARYVNLGSLGGEQPPRRQANQEAHQGC